MNPNKSDSPQMEATNQHTTIKDKYEEEVTIDLNTTQTNQEREYREFIRNEVENEASNLMNSLSLHCAKLSVGFLAYFIPGNRSPVQNAAVIYFGLSMVEQAYTMQKKIPGRSKSGTRLVLLLLEILCVIGMLVIESGPGLRLLIPTYLLLALFNLMMNCLEFSESIDEVFNVKVVRINLFRQL